MTGDPIACVAPLFVPATRPDRFAKAIASGTDAVVIDLEDAVAPTNKNQARDALKSDVLPRHPTIIRINGPATRWFEDDLRMVKRLRLITLMLPKAESAEDIDKVRRIDATVQIIAIIESAKGLANARQIACSRVARLVFGSLDYCVDMGCAHEPDALLLARSEIILASRLAGLPPPLDGVTTDIKSAESVSSDAQYSAKLGFGGKLCVHPTQITPVMRAFLPSDAEVKWAQTILELGGTGATNIGSTMVDEPVRLRARQILAKHSRQK